LRVRVIGVGSGFGDDAAGLAVIDWLAERALPAGVSLARCERPLPDLLDACEDADAAVLVDALCGAGPAGSLIELDEASIARERVGSSHGFGSARALALARSLERAPARIAWLAIAIDRPRRGAGLSEPVRDAVPAAGRRALELACRIGHLEGVPSPRA
jgi:hydrogenase maturation protease